MTVGIVIIAKGGEIREANVADTESLSMARKCGHRSAAHFAKRASWPAAGEKNVTVELWAKTEGRAGGENKYDFPPPVDKTLFFGGCCLVAKSRSTGGSVDLEASTWAKTYEKLFGGFEDLVDEQESEDELATVPDEEKTETGYLKDGFVTDGDGESSHGEESEGDEASAVSGSGSSDSEDEVPLESDESEGEGDELEEEEYDYEN